MVVLINITRIFKKYARCSINGNRVQWKHVKRKKKIRSILSNLRDCSTIVERRQLYVDQPTCFTILKIGNGKTIDIPINFDILDFKYESHTTTTSSVATYDEIVPDLVPSDEESDEEGNEKSTIGVPSSFVNITKIYSKFSISGKIGRLKTWKNARRRKDISVILSSVGDISIKIAHSEYVSQKN